MLRGILTGLALALAAWLLYFHGLGNVGLLSADEPRYADIGRHMAQSGDWITPKLWGEPWFEKPPLLYWMIAAGYRLRLPDEIAVRGPVALVSVAFLAFYWWWLRRQFGEQPAWYATAILSTCAGWLTYSQVGVTDLPMAAALGVCMILAMPGGGNLKVAGAFLGLAVLGKGLVPLVLAAPIWLMGWRRLADWVRPGLVSLAVALPWYLLCYKANGSVFFEEFIVKHHLSRFTTNELQHGQPLWFYIPVLLAGLFPWAPLVALLFYLKGGFYQDVRIRFLLLWFGVGFVFFSLAENKLPGYLLPLLPPLAALMGIRLAETVRRWCLASCALLLGLIPLIAEVLPEALRSGLSRASLPGLPWLMGVGVVLAVLVLRLTPSRSLVVIVAAVVLSVVWVKHKTYPVLDEAVSARGLFRRVSSPSQTCVEGLHRNLRYGLNFYAGMQVPDCETEPRPVRVVQQEDGPSILLPGGP